MARIGDYNTYTIHKLVELWDSGWQGFARFARSLHSVKLDPMYTTFRMGSGYRQIDEASLEGKIFRIFADALYDDEGNLGHCLNIPEGLPHHIELLNLAASSSRRPYAPADLESVPDDAIQEHLMERQGGLLRGRKNCSGRKNVLYLPIGVLPYGEELGTWSGNKRSFRKALQKTLNGFAKSDTFEEAFSEIAPEKQWQRFVRMWSPEVKVPGYVIGLEDYRSANHRAAAGRCSGRISPQLRQVMEVLSRCLAAECSFEETWWKCLWASVKPSIDILSNIERRINADIPLDNSDLERLNQYLEQGQPRIVQVIDTIGMSGQAIVLLHRSSDEIQSPFLEMIAALLMQPAFDISQSLQRMCGKLRFKRECRAPSCGRVFWTKRANATSCPGSNAGKKNACSLEWVRYTRYMVKIGGDPEHDWRDVQLKQDFIAYDNGC